MRSRNVPVATGRRATGFDLIIGARIRQRRLVVGLSQAELATRLGLTQGQLRKYESGSNRIAASRLIALAQVLDVTVAWFFEEATADSLAPNARKADSRMERKLVENFRGLDRDAQEQLLKISIILSGSATTR
jgi:transcriptional regulator with XRE-family HTH domain